jgi:hypothetical protein
MPSSSSTPAAAEAAAHKSLDASARSWSDTPSDVIHGYQQVAARSGSDHQQVPQAQKGTTDTMERTYALGAMDMAAVSRSRVPAMVNGSCSPAAFWSPIALGTTRKHGQPRRTKASP